MFLRGDSVIYVLKNPKWSKYHNHAVLVLSNQSICFLIMLDRAAPKILCDILTKINHIEDILPINLKQHQLFSEGTLLTKTRFNRSLRSF